MTSPFAALATSDGAPCRSDRTRKNASRAPATVALAATASASARGLESFLGVHLAAMQVLADRRNATGDIDDLSRWDSDLARVNHYYPAFASSWTQTRGPGLKEKIEAVRTKLTEYGVEKPIMITEVGWSNIYYGTDEIQGRYVVELFT